MADRKKSRLGLGILLGAVGGAVAALLYAPKSGKETREEASKKLNEMKKKLSKKEVEKKAKKIFGKVSKETTDLYASASKELLQKVADLKKRADRIDKDKYQKMIEDVVDDVKKTSKHSGQAMKLLKDSLASDWKIFITNGKRTSPKKPKSASKPKRKN